MLLAFQQYFVNLNVKVVNNDVSVNNDTDTILTVNTDTDTDTVLKKCHLNNKIIFIKYILMQKIQTRYLYF